jgi:hypothetical protein
VDMPGLQQAGPQAHFRTQKAHGQLQGQAGKAQRGTGTTFSAVLKTRTRDNALSGLISVN